MATPDHKAHARPSFALDGHLTTIPYTAQPTRSVACTVLTNRLGDNHLAHRDRGVTLRAMTRIAHRDGRRLAGTRRHYGPAHAARAMPCKPGMVGHSPT